MLTLHNDSSLKTEEIWLKKAYANIVYRLIRSTVITSIVFDPFVAEFMGINSVVYDKFQYQALLETTSYFWASKGGRGTLLEKIIASLASSSFSNGVTLSNVVSTLLSKVSHITSRYDQSDSRWLSNIQKLKFDLVNVIDGRLIILELKNRVDSGGTAAREEALRKKFFSICRIIENEEKVFSYHGKDYDFGELFSILGINRVEMYLGLLFNINGEEATLDFDKSNGFYSSSKTHMKNYVAEHHPIAELSFDEGKLSLFVKKSTVSVLIGMLYGNEVIRRFTSKEYHLTKLMEKVFSKSWDDIWLVFNIAISQRAMLLRNKNNHIIQIMNLKENDGYFNEIFTKFCKYSLDSNTLTGLVEYMQNKLDLPNISPPTGNEDNGYLADCLYAFASYVISTKRLLKSKKKLTADISKDINEEVLSKE